MIASLASLTLAIAVSGYAYWRIFIFSEATWRGSTFQIHQFERVTDYGCFGLMAIPILLGLSRAFWVQSQIFIYGLLGLLAVLAFYLVKNRIQLAIWRKKNDSSLARIELDDTHIRIFRVDGSLASESTFDDIVRLDIYQKEVPRGNRFEEHAFSLASGEEIVIDALVQQKKRLLRIIQSRTGLEFGYRRNSQRHQRPKRRKESIPNPSGSENG